MAIDMEATLISIVLTDPHTPQEYKDYINSNEIIKTESYGQNSALHFLRIYRVKAIISKESGDSIKYAQTIRFVSELERLQPDHPVHSYSIQFPDCFFAVFTNDVMEIYSVLQSGYPKVIFPKT